MRTLALDFGKVFLHYGWKKDIQALYRDIDAITAAEVQSVAQELFDNKQLTELFTHNKEGYLQGGLC